MSPPATALRVGVAAGCLVLLAVGCSAAGAGDATVRTVGADEAVELLRDRDDVVVVDVRTPEEFAGGSLADARLLDWTGGQFAAEVGDLDREPTYVLYCRTGRRSAEAAEVMADLGFREVYDAGGFADLAAAGAPLADG